MVHICAYIVMWWIWDPAQAVANVRKHGIAFADAVGALEDPMALTRVDRTPGEARFATVGIDILGRVVVVVWTMRDHTIRLISARRATPRERRAYHEGPNDAQGV